VIIATAASARQGAPVGFIIVWGLFATIMGWLLVTNYRGFLDRLLADMGSSNERMRRILPWQSPSTQSTEQQDRRRLMSRIVGGIFAIAGPVALIVGVVKLLGRPFHVHPLRFQLNVTGFGLFGAAFMLAVLIGMWVVGSPDNNLWMRGWRQGGAARIGAALLFPAGLLMVIGFATGLSGVFIAGWAGAAGSAVIILLARAKRGESSSGSA
jgi:hypothetical protein